jgi:hypothetical protein
MFGKKKCPRCDSKNINIVKPSAMAKFANLQKRAVFPWTQKLKNLNVCKACGFSWEDR